MAASIEYPSWEERPAGLDVSSDWCRLRWFLKGPIALSIHVIRNATDPDSAQEPYVSGNSTHPIADSSLTQPPISSIIVSSYLLDEYPDAWTYAHKEHADGCDEEGVVAYNGQGRLVRCCGEEKPQAGPKLQVKAKLGQYVTIGDYVEAVHPWLMSLQDRMRAAKGLHSGRPLSRDFDLFVYPLNPSSLHINDTKTKKASVQAFEWARLANYAVKKEQQQAERAVANLSVAQANQ